MLENLSLQFLNNKKNLLAFSGGGDSTALLFLLLQNKIPFDIAIVDYGLREQSKDEVLYAQELAKKYNFKCYIHKAKKIEKNFEAQARAIRYDFFTSLIEQYNYHNLLTAHHLGDRLEWMLMQFCKGSGCAELSGMQHEQKRERYTLVRPLLEYDKEELLEYLGKNNIRYFEDASNLDEKIQRNSFRHQFALPLLQQYKEGIKKSFEYIDEDVQSLIQESSLTTIEELAFFPSTKNIRSDIYTIDKYLKTQGYMMSASERLLLKEKMQQVVGREFFISQTQGYIFIAPYIQETVAMDKNFKERCRVLKIAPKLRVYLFKHPGIFEEIQKLLRSV